MRDARKTAVLRFPGNVSKGGKIWNRYNQVPNLTQDTNWNVTLSQLYTTNESQEVSPFPAGDHNAQINRRIQRHNKHKTEKNIKDPQKKYRLGTVSKIFYFKKKKKKKKLLKISLTSFCLVINLLFSSKVILTENSKLITKQNEVSEIFNSFFLQM